jgi:hypothetical protein
MLRSPEESIEREIKSIFMYILTRWTLGKNPRIEIDGARYVALKRAVKVQRAALDVEEKFDLVIANYEEFEREILSLTLGHMVRRTAKWGQMSDARLLLGRRSINLLSTCRLYIDQVKHSAKSPCFYGCTLDQINTLFSKQYDIKLGYRVMEALRNHVQHRSLPVNKISYPSDIQKAEDNNPLWSYKLSLGLDLDSLQQDPKFKKKILWELRLLSEIQNDIIFFVRQYVEGIAEVHSSLRELMTENVEAADVTIDEALSEWAAEGHKKTALAASKLRSNGKSEEHFFITSNLKDKRKELVAGNNSHMNLSRRFVTNVRPREAYQDFHNETEQSVEPQNPAKEHGMSTDIENSGAAIVATVKTKGNRQRSYAYDSGASSADIVSHSSAATGVTLEPTYFEEVTETVERSKGFMEGFKLAIEIPKVARFEFEKKHKKEIKKTTKRVFGKLAK